MRYAQHINREKGWKGHLWQGRYFSSPLDDAYLWAAIRYVERNPVRAKMVRKAERYPWLSTAAHCGLQEDGVLTQKIKWKISLMNLQTGVPGWQMGKMLINCLYQGEILIRVCPAGQIDL